MGRKAKPKAAKPQPNPLIPKTADVRLLVTEGEAARMLGLEPAYLKNDRRTERRIPFLRIGGLIRYVPQEMWELVEKWRAERDAALAQPQPPAQRSVLAAQEPSRDSGLTP